MSYYELMVIFSSSLTEEEERAQVLQVEELFKREKAILHLVDHWGKRKFAYPIKKQRQGYYEWFYLELDPSRLAEIDRKLKMSEVILRFMALRMEKIQIANLQKEIIRRSEAAQIQTETPEAVSEPPQAQAETSPVETEDPRPVEVQESSEENFAEPEQEVQEQSGGTNGDAK